jgi:hypothetical protein
MYGIFGEGWPDFDTLKAIVRKLKNDPGLAIRGRGFDGCDKLLKECSDEMKELYEVGCRRFIICHDADGGDPQAVRRKVEERVIKPASLGSDALHFVAVPVQMIEASILADIESASKLFTSWRPKEVKNPESIPKPKEFLEKASRHENSRPRYLHTRDNPRIVKYLDLERVAQKCPSFRPLREFVLGT